MDNEEMNITTNVETLDMSDIDALFDGIVSSDSIVTPAEEDKPNVLTGTKEDDLSFIDEKDESVVDTTAIIDELINEEDEDQVVADTTNKGKGGRPTVDKKGMAQLVTKLIEKDIIKPFEDDKKPEEYTLEDYEELITLNFQEKERELREQVQVDFFDSLPDKMKYAAKYIADGGQDLHGLFSYLAKSEAVESLDVSNEDHQERIVRSYLEAKAFGTPDEIDEEIESLKDLNKLETKAKQFKPKLDSMQEEILQEQVQKQEQTRKAQENMALKYRDDIYNVLKDGELAGVKIDSKTQHFLYKGLTQANYPSVTGRQTNLLGHYIEKFQFTEPDHTRILEVLHLLHDPKAYKDSIIKSAKNEVVSQTVRSLKTEQANKNSSTLSDNNESTTRVKPGIKRPAKNFFER